METIFTQDIQDKKALHYWYGGQVAVIKHKGFTFSIEAIGDIYATLYDENKEEIAYVKDKYNGGWFDNEMFNYIKDDNMLLDLLDRQKLVFDNNNWWECFVIDDKSNFHDLMWDLDSMNIYDAIDEVKEQIEKMIEYLEIKN